MKFYKIISLFIVFNGTVMCLLVIPERSNVTYINKKYIEWASLRTQRYSRRGNYYFHIEGRTLQTWANNISVHLIFNEYLHNEFRRSFIEMHFKFCDMINGEPFIGRVLARSGVVCPAPAREYHLMNLTTDTTIFPNVFPFEKGRIDIEAAITSTHEAVANGYIVATFKNEKKTSPKPSQ